MATLFAKPIFPNGHLSVLQPDKVPRNTYSTSWHALNCFQFCISVQIHLVAKLEGMSCSKLHSLFRLFRLTGQLPIVKGRFALKHFQVFSPWSEFPFSSVPFTFLFMPPSSLSAPQQHLSHCWRKHRTIWKKCKIKKAGSCFPVLLSPSVLQPSPSPSWQGAISFFSLQVCFCCSLLYPGSSVQVCAWHLQQVCICRGLWPGVVDWAGLCHHQTPEHIRWGKQQGGTRGDVQALCSTPESCCNHNSTQSLLQVSGWVPL